MTFAPSGTASRENSQRAGWVRLAGGAGDGRRSDRLEARCPATGLARLRGKPDFERSHDGRMKVEMRLVRLKTHHRLGALGSDASQTTKRGDIRIRQSVTRS